jgi:hypothetical protein
MRTFIGLFLLSLLFANSDAQNRDSVSSKKKVAPWFVERFKLSAGFFLPVNNTNIKVGIQGRAQGTEVNLNHDLGFSNVTGTFSSDFQWRISRRSHLNGSFYNINRHSTHTLQKDLIFKEDTFHINASVSGYFNTAIYQISYGYSILAKPKYEVGLMVGTHLVGGKIGLSLNAGGAGISKSGDFGFTAPLPDLGIWGDYALTNRLAFILEADYLALSVGNYSGNILAYNVSFTYKLLNQFNLSLGYMGLNFKLDLTEKNATASLKWGYNGPDLALTFSFGKRSWSH